MQIWSTYLLVYKSTFYFSQKKWRSTYTQVVRKEKKIGFEALKMGINLYTPVRLIHE